MTETGLPASLTRRGLAGVLGTALAAVLAIAAAEARPRPAPRRTTLLQKVEGGDIESVRARRRPRRRHRRPRDYHVPIGDPLF